MAYSSLNVRPRYAELARAIAQREGVPLTTLLERLIEEAGRNCGLTVANAIQEAGDGLAILVIDPFARFTRDEASELASQLRAIVAGRSASINANSPAMIVVSRRGVGIVVELTNSQGHQVRASMSKREAEQLADDIQAFIAK